MKISVVIPTKNRPHALLIAVKSIAKQIRKPDQLVVIDQSGDTIGRDSVTAEMQPLRDIQVTYVHDQAITGLVAAKAESLKFATGEIICFLEDDIVLEENYLAEMESGFLKDATMLGCSGVVTNPPVVSPFYLLIFNIFHRGIFADARPLIYAGRLHQSTTLVVSEVLSGGLSAWRREVFAAVSFDVANGFHMFEDIDFSTRVARHFGPHLYINPNARLEHHCSSINREVLGPRQRRKITECVVFYKKRRDWPWATFSFSWLLLGLCIESIFQSWSSLSFGPIRGYFFGLRDGFVKKIVYL